MSTNFIFAHFLFFFYEDGSKTRKYELPVELDQFKSYFRKYRSKVTKAAT